MADSVDSINYQLNLTTTMQGSLHCNKHEVNVTLSSTEFEWQLSEGATPKSKKPQSSLRG